MKKSFILVLFILVFTGMVFSLKADLVVTRVSFYPNPIRARKDMVRFEVIVTNKGDRPQSRKCSLSMSLWAVYSNGQRDPSRISRTLIPWYTNNIPILQPGEECRINSRTITIAQSGRYKLNGVIITEGLQQNEELHTNNYYEKFFNVMEPPRKTDLQLRCVQVKSTGRIMLCIYNKLRRIPACDFRYSYVKMTVDGVNKIMFLRDIDPERKLLRPRTMLRYSWPTYGFNGIRLRPNHYYRVKVVLDYSNRISDTNRSNNRQELRLHY